MLQLRFPWTTPGWFEGGSTRFGHRYLCWWNQSCGRTFCSAVWLEAYPLLWPVPEWGAALADSSVGVRGSFGGWFGGWDCGLRQTKKRQLGCKRLFRAWWKLGASQNRMLLRLLRWCFRDPQSWRAPPAPVKKRYCWLVWVALWTHPFWYSHLDILPGLGKWLTC